MVKSLFLISFFIFNAAGLQAFAQNALISDLDDTLKRTNVQDPVKALYNALFTQDVFSAMDSLFRTMGGSSDLYILSASPKVFMFNIDELMEENDISPVDIFARGRDDMDDKIKYKYETIEHVAAKGYDRLILMGDDVEADPAVYDKYIKNNPERVAAIYIHKVTGAKLPESAVGYYSSYGIALRETLAGRMTVDEAYAIGEAFLAKDMEEAFPDFVICPESVEEIDMPEIEGLEELTRKVAESIATYCRNRDE